jgi:hypothetical protein
MFQYQGCPPSFVPRARPTGEATGLYILPTFLLSLCQQPPLLFLEPLTLLCNVRSAGLRGLSCCRPGDGQQQGTAQLSLYRQMVPDA